MSKVFVTQKRMYLRSVAGLKDIWRSNSELDSCRPIFKKYEILMFTPPLYPRMYMKYLVKQPEQFRKKSEVPPLYQPKNKVLQK